MCQLLLLRRAVTMKSSIVIEAIIITHLAGNSRRRTCVVDFPSVMIALVVVRKTPLALCTHLLRPTTTVVAAGGFLVWTRGKLRLTRAAMIPSRCC